MRRSWKTIEVAAGIVFVVAFLGGAGMHQHYGTVRSTLPNPQEGRVHSLVLHGKSVYLTGDEEMLLYFLFGVSAIALSVGIAVDVLVDPFVWRRRHDR